MSDEGERTCPLCAEEMDLTDRQLKPCKCGYEICVWCWHHIMDMAEKDDTEGRCPACRAPYDKEKIVGMAAKCERIVAEMSTERKMKSQKAKAKSSDGRKQLSSVRVIQRNLVYIVGLPLNLADEELLQHREYFGQYGKVLKVSMSRTAAGVIQQFPNNTCSVYITYSKEEDAIRCIQNVHGFILDGRPLKACFGTTKYCHAWLRNVPCINPDCLYLHEIGSQEDSFTKDEIISAYTRSRVQQITGAAINVQRRSGSVLPPPIDDCSINGAVSSGKSVSKICPINAGNIAKGSPPSSACCSISLPAAGAWGIHGANGPLSGVNSTCSNGHSKQKPDTTSETLAFSLAVAGTAQASTLQRDGGKTQPAIDDNHSMHTKLKPESLKHVKQHINSSHIADLSEKPTEVDEAAALNLSNHFSGPPESNENDAFNYLQPNMFKFADQHGQTNISAREREQKTVTVGRVQNLCSEMSSLSIATDDMDKNSESSGLEGFSGNSFVKSCQGHGLKQFYDEQSREPSTIPYNISVDGVSASRDQCDRSDAPTKVLLDASTELDEDEISFDNQRLKDPEVVTHSSYLPNSINGLHSLSQSRLPLKQHEAYDAVNITTDILCVDDKVGDNSLLSVSNLSNFSETSNRYSENLVRSSVGSARTLEHSILHPSDGTGKQMEILWHDGGNADVGFVDKAESSIISDMLSWDFDSFDEPLTSPQNLANLLGDGEKFSGPHKVSSSWKAQTNNQSRFSFARQEESINQTRNVIGPLSKNHSSSHDIAKNRDSCFDKVGICNGFSSSSFEEPHNLASNQLPFFSNKLSVSRAQISAPPGFSVPSRAPPPGFSSHERVDQAFDPLSGMRLADTSLLLRNAYQPQTNGNMVGTADIEFMDPAILAVVNGRLQGGNNNPALEMRSNFPSQEVSSFENDARLQLLMQRSLPSRQSLRFPDVGDNFSHLSDSYGISSRLVNQSQASNLSPFAQMAFQQNRNGLISNGHWDSWNEGQVANTLGMAELLRNDRLGFNKFYDSYEDSKFRMPTSGDIYSRTYGM